MIRGNYLDTMLKNMYSNTEIISNPISKREQQLRDIIKKTHLKEFLELENIMYQVHNEDLEKAYIKGFMDCYNKKDPL